MSPNSPDPIILLISRLQEKLQLAIDNTRPNPKIFRIQKEIIETEEKYRQDKRLIEKGCVDDEEMLLLKKKWNKYVESMFKVEGVVDEVLEMVRKSREAADRIRVDFGQE